MQSKATNSSLLSAYHFVLKPRMTNAQAIKHHISAIAICSLPAFRLMTPRRHARDSGARKRATGHAVPRIRVARSPEPEVVNEMQGKECRPLSVTRSFEDGWADRLRSVESAPKASCIQISRLCLYEAGDVRDHGAASQFGPFCTTTYYI